MLGRTGWGLSLSLASDHHGPARLAVPGWRLLSEHSFPDGLSLQTAKSFIHNANLPSKYKLEWKYMSRYFEITMFTRPDHLQSVTVNLFTSDRSKPRRSPGARDCACQQDRSRKVHKTGARMDRQICNVSVLCV